MTDQPLFLAIPFHLLRFGKTSENGEGKERKALG